MERAASDDGGAHMPTTGMTEHIVNELICFGPETEIARFRKLFEAAGFVPNWDSFFPVPEAVTSIPLNHSQQENFGLKEWSLHVRGFADTISGAIIRADSCVASYRIMTTGDSILKAVYKISRLFAALEFDVIVEQVEHEHARYYLRSGDVIPLRSYL